MEITNVLRYPKINTLWKRNKKQKIKEGKYSVEEYGIFNQWHVFEKINGTNIRIFYSSVDDSLSIDSRYEHELIDELQSKIEQLITKETIKNVFPEKNDTPSQIVLFGEGVGKRTGSFGKNFKEHDFYLFDIFAFDQHAKRRNIHGWWLKPGSIIDVSQKLGVKSAPFLGNMTINEIVDHIKSKPKSKIANATSEGIVAKTTYNLLDREGNPLQFKLKVNDYGHLNY